MKNSLRIKKEQNEIIVAASLFVKDGIEAVKMTDIAEVAEVGVATLYRHFTTKSNLAIKAATVLWDDVKLLFSDVLDSAEYQASTGINQLSSLFNMFLTLYTEHGGFLKFMAELDTLLLSEEFNPEDIANYENAIINLYPICEATYKKGLADGTIRKINDFSVFYSSYTHALMNLGQKFIRGEVLPGDDFSNAEEELKLLIDSAINYIKK